jgi:hypothetical protein
MTPTQFIQERIDLNLLRLHDVTYCADEVALYYIQGELRVLESAIANLNVIRTRKQGLRFQIESLDTRVNLRLCSLVK